MKTTSLYLCTAGALILGGMAPAGLARGVFIERGCKTLAEETGESVNGKPSIRVGDLEYTPRRLEDGRIELTIRTPDGQLFTKCYADAQALVAAQPELSACSEGGLGITSTFLVASSNVAGVVETPPVLVDVHHETIVLVPAAAPGEAPFGISPGAVDPLLRAQLGLAEDEGVPVLHILYGSAASRLGVRLYDVIIEANGARVGSAEALGTAWRETRVGETFRVVVLRGGRPLVLAAEKDAAMVAPVILDGTPRCFGTIHALEGGGTIVE